MTTNNFSRVSGTDFLFFSISVLTWLTFYLIVNFVDPNHTSSRNNMVEFLLFSTAVTALSHITLKISGFFNGIRVIPRKSDPVIVLFAVASVSLITHIFFSNFLFPPFIDLQLLALSLPVFTIAVLSAYTIALKLHFKNNRKKIVLDLLPDEQKEFLKSFTELGQAEYIEFLTRNQLAEYVLSGNTSSIQMIVISRNSENIFDENPLLLKAHLAGIPILDNRHVGSEITGRIKLEDCDLWTFLISATPQTYLLRAFSRLKSLTEPVAAVILAIILAPAIITVTLLIKITSPGPVLYRQARTGLHGKVFTLIKFRSMTVESEPDGPQWSGHNDSRITPLGNILRKTRLDELPQLWNVIKGEMGFFGPRPERPEIYQKLKQDIPLFSLRTIVKPGISGWAQVMAGYAASIEESRTKLEYDMYYIQNMSPRLDLIILIQTLKVAVFGSAGSGQIPESSQDTSDKATVIEHKKAS